MHRAIPMADPAGLPDAAGAYALLIELTSPLAIDRPRLAALAAGGYVYAGSARGSGGIRARAGRHLRAGKRPRWHIDRLTTAEGVGLLVLALPGGRECGIVEVLVRRCGAAVPVPGFGSSDCRRCPAHLLAVPSLTRAVAVLGRFVAGQLAA